MYWLTRVHHALPDVLFDQGTPLQSRKSQLPFPMIAVSHPLSVGDPPAQPMVEVVEELVEEEHQYEEEFEVRECVGLLFVDALVAQQNEANPCRRLMCR